MIEKIEKLLKMDDYDLEAVFTPAVVNMLLFGIVFTCTLLSLVEDTIWWQSVLAIASSLAVSVALTRFIMNAFRGISRIVFENTLYHKDRLYFPTTSMLLLGDNSTGISKMMKDRVRADLKALYNIKLLTKGQEAADEMEARRTAKDAVHFIRKAVADNGDAMTRRKLKRYGMFRNFLGGAICCLPLSFLCWGFGYNHTGAINSTVLAVLIIYLIVCVIDFFITKSASIDYAETLITTFDKINHNEA